MQALAYVASDEKLLSWLMAETGLDPRDLSRSADSAETMAGVLDFLLAHEDILIDFCNHENLDKTSPAIARQHLPGAYFED